MAEWKNIVVETSANTIKQNTEGTCTGFSDYIGFAQGGMGNIGNYGIFTDNPAANRHEFVTIDRLVSHAMDTLGTPAAATTYGYTHYTALPTANNEVYMLAYNDNSGGNILNSNHGKDYYWHKYGGEEGQLSAKALTQGAIEGTPVNDMMIGDFIEVGGNITFTGTSWEADNLIVDNSLVVTTFTADNNTFTESATTTTHTDAGQATTNDSTITFNTGHADQDSALTSLLSTSHNHEGVGFRVLNTGTTSHDIKILNLASSPTGGSNDHNTDVFFYTNQKIETTGSGGWELTFNKINIELGNTTAYTLDHDLNVSLTQTTHSGTEGDYKVTLNASASVNSTAWGHLVNFAQGNDSNVSDVILKNKAVKQNIQFGLFCNQIMENDGNGALNLTDKFVYPAVHKLKGNLQLDVSANTIVESAYGVESGAMITNVADQADRPIGAITIGGTATSPVPMLRVA